MTSVNRLFSAVLVIFAFCFGPSLAHAFGGNSVYVERAAGVSIFVKTEGQIEKGAIKFIEKMSTDATGFLGNEEITQERRIYLFKNLLVNSFDMDVIARFSLGRYWRTAGKPQRKEYLELFEEMILEIYSGRFKEYGGQEVNVVKARKNGKSDWIVSSVIVPQNSGPDISVEWRTRYKDGRYRVIDIIVEGVSMGVTQRSDFASVIQRGGGDIEVLLAHLRDEEKK